MTDYQPEDWHWIVGDDTDQAWSSAASAYVTGFDPGRATRIDSEEELTDLLRAHGLRGPSPSAADYEAAIQQHLDDAARARNYRDGFALAGYVTSGITHWAAEAAAFVAGRDAVWLYAFAELDKVQTGLREQPTIEAFIAELPAIEWPEA